MQQIKQMMWVIALGLLSVSSFADIYIGGALYQSKMSDSNGGDPISDNKTTVGVKAGYEINNYFAVEAGHYDLGTHTTQSGLKISGSGPTLGVNLTMPLTLVDVYAKAGVAYVVWNGGADKTTDAYYGIGADAKFFPLVDLYVEYLKFNTDLPVDMIGLGVKVKF